MLALDITREEAAVAALRRDGIVVLNDVINSELTTCAPCERKTPRSVTAHTTPLFARAADRTFAPAGSFALSTKSNVGAGRWKSAGRGVPVA